MTKIYVTKYALTSGISEHDAEVNVETGRAKYKVNEYWVFVSGMDYHLNKYSAVKRAEEMRIKKLQSLLDKQIKKISALKF